MNTPARWALAASVLLITATPASGQTPTVAELTSLAGRYVSSFLDVFSNVVAEETYEQESSWTRGGQRRELKSDFLLVLPPDSPLWIPFRDVFEVDGRPVRDRQERLTKLLLQPTKSALDRANQIAQEGARYNIEASMKRTINNPLLALAFIQADNQPRFRFSLDRRDPAEGVNVWIIEFREEARPTAIKGAFDKDMPVKGRYWIDGGDGSVIRSEVVVEDPSVGARITTDFQWDDRFKIDVPVRMSEIYRLINGRVVTGTATYGRFRRFGVSTDEKIDEPPR
jgi:hypothetical protein